MRRSLNDLLFAATERTPKNYPWILVGFALGILLVVLFITFLPQ